MATIYDVARVAGVSPKTVSRVMNGDAPVNAKTREIVTSAMSQLGYVPSSAARTMRSRRTGRPGRITGGTAIATIPVGEIEIDEAARVLRLRGEPVPVQPLVLALLGYMVRNAGRVVPKDELLGTLWPGVHVTEASLQRTVSLARAALRAGGMESALRIIPCLGYRFALDRPVLRGLGPAEDVPAAPALVRAREVATCDWAEADRDEQLGPKDLDLWAYALTCKARFRAAVPVYARAIEGYLRAGAPFRAARSAVSLGIVELELDHRDAARVWIACAEDLLGPDGPSEILAFALWLKSRVVSTEGDQDEAMTLARRAVDLAEAAESTSMRALALAYEGLYSMTLGDVAAGRARQDHAAATGLSGEVDPLTGTMIYRSILWTCRTFADWSRAAQWSPGFDLWCRAAYGEVTSASRLQSADVMASVGRLRAALGEVERSIQLMIEEGTWELGDAYRVRGDIRAMMGDTAAARADYQRSLSLGWDVEPGLAWLRAEAGDVPGALAALDRSLAGPSWFARQRRAWLLANKAQIAAGAGLVDVAEAALADLDGWPDAASVPAVQAMAREARANLLAAGAPARAIPDLQAARQLWLGVRHEYHAARLQLRLADLMERSGDVESARLERSAAHLAAERIGACGLLDAPIGSAA